MGDRGSLAAFVLLVATAVAPPSVAQAPTSPERDLDVASAARFADLALACVHREYPNKIAHVLQGDADVAPPRELTPVFYGCYDWHSAVHGHWLLARLARTFPDAPFAAPARAALAKSFVPEKVAVEVRYLKGPGRIAFERPYGLAWLLQLAAELREWDDSDARVWSGALEPLEKAAAERLREWLPKLTYPVRIGEHDQTAFALGLALDWSRTAADRELERTIRDRALAWYRGDRACPLTYEPSGQDFLSPCLAEADLLRRLLPEVDYAAWLGAFLPNLPLDPAPWLDPAVVSDPSDPKLAHLDGLNLSRAWMLEGIAGGLPEGDPRRPGIEAAARRHRLVGLLAVTGAHYEGGHWLGSFAVYLVTGRAWAPRSEKQRTLPDKGAHLGEAGTIYAPALPRAGMPPQATTTAVQEISARCSTPRGRPWAPDPGRSGCPTGVTAAYYECAWLGSFRGALGDGA